MLAVENSSNERKLSGKTTFHFSLLQVLQQQLVKLLLCKNLTLVKATSCCVTSSPTMSKWKAIPPVKLFVKKALWSWPMLRDNKKSDETGWIIYKHVCLRRPLWKVSLDIFNSFTKPLFYNPMRCQSVLYQRWWKTADKKSNSWNVRNAEIRHLL